VDVIADLGLPSHLRDVGVKEEQLDVIANRRKPASPTARLAAADERSRCGKGAVGS
jgi:hypothetical protein